VSEDPQAEGPERAHEEFVSPGALPEGANVPDAEARLLKALERELGVTIEPASEDAELSAEAKAQANAAGPRIVRRSRPRPLMALAAVVLAAVGLVWSQQAWRRARESPLLRGPSPSASPGAWDARPIATRRGDGHVQLTWASAPRATRYSVTFLGADLRPLARVDSLTATTLELDRVALPAGLVPGRTVLWRVSAYAGRDELARSVTVPLALP
jgi:hypothetical protein